MVIRSSVDNILIATNGTNGQPGTPGTSSYIHIKYSNDGGKTFTANSGEAIGAYIGIYRDSTEEDSSRVSDYQWKKIEGEDGEPAYTVMLSNENFSISTDTSYVPIHTQSFTCNVTVLKGSSPASFTITASTDTENDIVTTVNGHAVNITVAPVEALSATQGVITLTISTTEGHSFTKDITWSVATQGRDGQSGTSGVSINDVVNYYLITIDDTPVTKEDSGWSTTIQSMTEHYPYLWTYEVIIGSDGSTISSTEPMIIGRYGRDGEAAAEGRGILSIAEHYQVSSSNTNPPTTWSDTPVVTDNTNKYLWNYETITYTDNTTEDTQKRVIGTHGTPGTPGTSITISSTSVKYAISASSTQAPTDESEWGTAVKTTTEEKQYLWTRTIVTYSDNTSTTSYSVARQGIDGTNGTDGKPGKDGKDGTSTYVHIKYSAVANPTDSDLTENPSDYIGICNDSNIADPTTASSYTWSKWQGHDGQNGQPGAKGEDGTNSYIHFAYSSSSDGSEDFSTTSFDGALYIGILVDDVLEDSSDYEDYEWSLIKGADGTSVEITSTSVQYAISADGVTVPADSEWGNIKNTTNKKQYLWTRTIVNYSDNTTTTSFSVARQGLDGTNGKDGQPGTNGKDGTSTYVHIKYSAVANPTNSDLTETPSDYIGICHDSNVNDPTTASSYAWSKWIGEDGNDGKPGKDGTNGTSSYTHFAYANSSDGSEDFSTSSFPDAKYIGIRVDEVRADSTNYLDYTWNLIKGADGEDGVSITSVINHYLATSASSGVTKSTSGWTTTIQNIDEDKQFLWNYEEIKGSDGNTISSTNPVIIGRYGTDGTPGDAGRGITSITEHYQVSSSNTTPPSSWSDTPVATDATNKYLWNYETITYTDNTTKDTKKRVIGSQGTSVTVSSTQYQSGTSNTTPPTGSWSNSPVTVTAGNYLWTKVTYSDGKTAYSVARQGVNGTSVTVSTVEYAYQLSTSGTTIPTGTWKTTPQAPTTTKYAWTRTTTTFSDGSTAVTYTVGGKVGEKGSTGDNGRGIVSITEYFLLSDTDDASKITFPEQNDKHGWTTVGEALIWSKTKPYLWHCTEVVYENPSSTVYIDKYCDTSWKAADLVQSNLTDFQQGVDNVIDRDNQSIRSAVWENTYTYKPKTDSEGHYMYDDDGKIIPDKDNTRTMSQYMAEQIVDMDGITSRVSSTEANVDGIGNRLSTAESTITQHATDIEAKVAKDGVIAAINLSTETDGGSTAKISADKVEINGTAIFNSIKDKTDEAYDTKGAASQAESNAKSAIPTKVSQLTNDSKFQTDTDVSETVEQINKETISRGEQLVTNGNGMLGNNTNFSQLTFTGEMANSSPGSFTRTGKYASIFSNYYFPIDASKKYRFEFDIMSKNNTGTMYSMLAFYDVDKNSIMAYHHMHYKGTLTKLAKELKPGDTVLYLEDASNYKTYGTQNHQRALIFWDYKNSYGYQYPPETYSRNYMFDVWENDSSIDKTANTITLKTAYTGATKPVGTYVSQGSSAANYKYTPLSNKKIPTEWTHYVGIYDGTDYSGKNVLTKFSPGVAYCKVGFLWNSNSSDDQFWITNISVYEDVKTDIADLKTTTASANYRSQQIYYRKTTSGAPSKNTTWLSASGTGYGNWSLSIPPLTNGDTKYPYLYTAVQTQTVAQQAAGDACTCSDVLIDDTTTIIDGGNIITGTVTAREITADNLQGDHGWINLKDGKFYYGDKTTFDSASNAISWNGSKLQIKADEFLLASGKSIFDEVEAIETWFYATAPTTSNEPAKNWTTDNLKKMHLRDIYFDTNSGKSYRWAIDGTTYKWIEIEDKELSALAGRVATAETNISTNSEQIALRATKTEIANTYATKDSVPTSVTDLSDADNYATKTYADDAAGTAETNAKNDTANKLKSYYTKTETDSAISQTAEGITTRVTKLETRSVGNYATSSTGAGTTAKVATIVPAVTGWELYKGAVMTVKFTATNTASAPTLNVNSTGAKPIKTYSGGNLSEAEYKWDAGTTMSFVYDGTNWRIQDSSELTRLKSAETSISQNAEAISLRATKTEAQGYATTAENNAKNDTTNKLKSYSTTSEMNSAIEQKANEITSSVSETYATKTSVPTKTSDLTNDSGFATESYADGKASAAQSAAEATASADATNKANAAEQNAKSYVDTEIGTAKTEIKQTTDSISARVTKTEAKIAGHYATSSTAVDTGAKVATITPATSDWELYTGASVTVKFSSANTNASPTLNVNGKGAKAIKSYTGENLSEAEYKWSAGATITFVYNGSNWLMQDSGAIGRVASAETSISQNSEAISLRATKTEAQGYANTAESNAKSYADDAVSTAKAEIKVTTDGISSTVEKIGGFKYLVSATDGTSWTNFLNYAQEGKETSFTIESGALGCRVGDNVYLKYKDTTNNVFRYIRGTVIEQPTADNKIKLVAHGYEDIRPVDTIKSTINQSADSVKIKAKHIEIDGTAIFTNEDFKAAADAAYDAKGSASAVQENLDNLEIGGRNLLRHTKDFAESTYTSTCTFAKDTEDITVITFPAYTGTLSWKGCTFHPNIPYTLIRNKTVTLSFWYRSDSWTVASDAHNYPLPSFEILATSTANPSGNDRLKYTTIYDATVPAPTTEWQQFVRTYNITDSFFTAGSGTVTADKYFTIQFFQHNLSQLQYKKFKLEIGNKVTDWSPAPEDTDAAIDTAIKSVAQNWFANCDTAAATADKVATITPATEIFTLKTGDTVNVKFKYTNSYSATASSPCTLNINGTGAKHIYYGGSATPTGINPTAFGRAGYTNTYVYDGEYWVWVSSSADNNTTYNLGQNQHSSAIKATNAITKQHIICGTSVGYKMLAASTEFDLSYPLLYTTVNIADEKTSTSTFLTYPGITYTTTGTITAGAANAIIYLRGTVTGNTFKTTAAPFMTCTAPTSEDGYFYIPLGTMTSATAGYFNSSRNLYAYIDGKFRQVTPTEIVVSQRIYYRSYVAGTVSKPTAWITQTGNKYNDTVSVGNSGWSTKITPIAKSIAETTATNKKYLFLYTCEQRKRLDGTVDCTPILLDDSTTVIDGGNIITGTVTANQIAANAVTAEKIASHSISTNHLDIGDNTNLAQANENIPNSLPGQVWNGTSYDGDGTSFTAGYKLNIQDGYLVKKSATQTYMMFTDFVPSSFRTGDELYYEFYAKAASATTISVNCWGYTEKYTSSICNDYVTEINLTTDEKLISGTIQLTKEQWNTTAKYYLLGFNNNASTKVQISVRKVIFRKKNAGELIVDGSITANKIQGNSLSIGVFDTATQNSVLNSNLKVGGRNLIVNTNIIDVSNDALLPRIISQPTNTMHSGVNTAAEHGFRTTVSSAARPAIRFGSNSATATMNGLSAGETYTFSFDCSWKMLSSATANADMAVWLQDDRTTTGTLASHRIGTFGTAQPGVESSARCECSFTIPTNVTMCNLYISSANSTASAYAQGDYIELANIKLEEGNMASSWTAAPEDIDEDMKSSFNAINDTISNIKIGGRNLFINTNAPETTSAKRPKMIGQTQNSVVNTKAYVTEHGFGDISSGTKRPYIRFGNNTVGSESLNGLTAGNTYAFSADCEYLCTGVNAGSSIRLRIGYMTEGATSFTVETIATLAEVTAGVNDSVRCETVFTIPEEATGFYLIVDCTDTSHFADGDYIGLDNLKLEEGNKATAWSPAPEDINNSLVSVNDRVDATNEAINGFETTVTGWLTFENAKLTIGQKEKNNIFRTEITGTEMSFWEDTTKVAYISNKELNITDATIKENLTIGKFIFRPHESGDGGMSLIWS